MRKLQSFAVWIPEMLCAAIGTTTWIVVVALIQFGPDRGHYRYGILGIIGGISAIVLIEFALTGYLFTTLFAALFLPHRNWFIYPGASFFLYLIHSEAFFVAAGNQIFDEHNMAIQIGGACIAFASTTLGNRVRKLWA